MGSKALKKQWTGLRVSMTTLMLVVGVATVLIALLPAEAQQPHEKPLQTTGALEENEANAKDGYRKLEESRGIVGVEPKEEGRVRKKRGLWSGRRRRRTVSCPCVSYCPRRSCGGWYWYRRCSVGYYCCNRTCSFYVG
ncbi:uncharacterized protein [Branchiostoma lanceolatum]|uniref:uncharacterized protein n=1 Tax=Branchiostoma lanceolatum TaxID=7740 RepID=UPI0034514AE1